MFLLARQRASGRELDEHAFDAEMKFVFSQTRSGRDPPGGSLERGQGPSAHVRQEQELSEYFAAGAARRTRPRLLQRAGRCRRGAGAARLRSRVPWSRSSRNMVRDTSAFDRDVGSRALREPALPRRLCAAAPRPAPGHPRPFPRRPACSQYAKYNRFFVCQAVREHCGPLPRTSSSSRGLRVNRTISWTRRLSSRLPSTLGSSRRCEAGRSACSAMSTSAPRLHRRHRAPDERGLPRRGPRSRGRSTGAGARASATPTCGASGPRAVVWWTPSAGRFAATLRALAPGDRS